MARPLHVTLTATTHDLIDQAENPLELRNEPGVPRIERRGARDHQVQLRHHQHELPAVAERAVHHLPVRRPEPPEVAVSREPRDHLLVDRRRDLGAFFPGRGDPVPRHNLLATDGAAFEAELAETGQAARREVHLGAAEGVPCTVDIPTTKLNAGGFEERFFGVAA